MKMQEVVPVVSIGIALSFGLPTNDFRSSRQKNFNILLIFVWRHFNMLLT